MRKLLVSPIPDFAPMQNPASRFRHVVIHLYEARERWDLVCGPDARTLRANAVEICGEATLAGRTDNELYHRACDRCRAHVLADETTYYAPAYKDAIRHRVAEAPVQDRGEGPGTSCVGANGVFVIIRDRYRDERPVVTTAYRVVPRGGRENPSNEEFVSAAVRKVNRQSSVAMEGHDDDA